jgi:drug/metabolite transporter (DMT)-like permease
VGSTKAGIETFVFATGIASVTPMLTDAKRLRAVQMLILANAFWALSFPTVKALVLLQRSLVENTSTWFLTGVTLTFRFGMAAIVMAIVCRRTMKRLTRLECWQGLGLGVFASAGLMLQMDGLAYTSASTSAFLTQFYCLLIPLIMAWRERRWPPRLVVVACVMVIAGVAVLSDINWRQLKIGRGEIETLLGSTIFTAQILWLQRPKFAANDVNHFSFVMFAVITVTSAPLGFLTQVRMADWFLVYDNFAALGFLAILCVFCTLGAYRLMNRWQPLLTATQAGLLYCLEPVFASLFALFLPAVFSSWTGISYANEQLTADLLVGGALITVANAIIQLAPAAPPSARLEGSIAAR